MAEDELGGRREDAFIEAATAFSKIADFKNFARSISGLCLEEAAIQTIVENYDDVQEQKIQMLNKWKEKNGEKATALEIKDIVERFRKGGVPKNYISLQGGIYGADKNQPLCGRSHVYLGEQKSKAIGSLPRAIKFLAYNDENLKEAKIVAELGQHENVVSTYYAGVYEEGPLSKFIYIVMDLCSTKNLFEYLKECRENGDAFDESERWNMIIQLFKALDFIHKKNIIHRDLKPHNILFAQDMKTLKLADFGLSKVINQGSATLLSKIAGTNGYIAPEVHTNTVITKKSDIFAAGITEAEILSNGRHPFGDVLILRDSNIANNKKPDLKNLLVFDKKTAKKLIKHALKFKPEERPTAEEVLKDVNSLQFLRENRIVTYSYEGQKEVELMTASEPLKGEICIADGIIVFHVYDKHLYFYKPSAEEWERLLQTIEPQEFSTVKLKKHIYTLKNKEVHRLKYQDKTTGWKRQADMLEDHGTTPSAAVLKGLVLNGIPLYFNLLFGNAMSFSAFIYVCGKGNMFPVKSAEHYNSISNQWTMIQDMNVARRRPGIVATKDHLYCIGGWGEITQKMASVERYDEDTNEWKNVEPTIRPTIKASAVVLNDLLFVADDVGVQCYDIQSTSWRELNFRSQWPLRLEYTTKLLVVDQKLYLIGYTQDLQQRIYLLDPEKEIITLVDHLTEKQILIHACVAV